MEVMKKPSEQVRQEMKKVNTDNMEKTGELALIECLPKNVLPTTKNGRLQNRLIQLQNAVHSEFSRMPYISLREKNQALNKIMDFGEKTGWDKRERHPVTLISFLLGMVENSKFKYNQKITTLLNEIFDYYERAKQAKNICCVAGALGNEKWEAI